MPKAPAFQSYEEFLEFCTLNRKWALNLLAKTWPYTPFIFGDFSDKNGLVTVCVGYRVITDLLKLLRPRVTSEYKAWRKSVLNRDAYKCHECGVTKDLHVHHIEPVKTNIKKMTDPNNGITLCNKCHRKIHTNV